MAEAIAPLEFTGSDRATVVKLALVMKGVAAVLLLLAVVNVVGGILTLVGGFPLGLLAVVEGALSGLLGLIMLSCSADVRYTVDTPYAGIHLGNAFRNLTAFYQTQFGLAILLVVVMVVRLLVG